MNPRSFHNGKVELWAGDCMEVLRELPDNSIDAVVTDPPYHLTSIVKRFSKNGYSKSNLEQPANKKIDGGVNAGAFRRLARGFMGKVWDGGDIAFTPELWAEVLRVLKPGGHMVCFGGTRTYHRMACAIEDAGFEIRDQLAWTYGSGFPKSHDVSKALDGVLGKQANGFKYKGGDLPTNGGSKFRSDHPDYAPYEPATDAARRWQGWGTALKPAWEPICLARKPLSESTVAANVLRWGTGAINVDGCRVVHDGECRPIKAQSFEGREDRIIRQAIRDKDTTDLKANGRWPANLIHGSPEVLAGFPDAGVSAGGSRGAGGQNGCYRPIGAQPDFKPGFGDSGSAARFFACFPMESETCTPLNANAAKKTFSLSSERAVSVLSHAVEASTERLALRPQSYRGQDMNVSENQLEDVSTLLTAIILHLEKRFLRGLLPERHSLSSSLANIVAIPKPIGTIAIMISLSKSSGFVDVVTFDLIETNAEAGVEGYAKRFHYTSKADDDDRLNSKHPTVKPVDLMQWLVRLICPKGGTVLDPFAGTGTTGAATFIEGCRAVLIEREAEYLADIERRMELLLSGPDERARKLAKADPHESLPLFGAI